jgi:protein-disulfide isomerase
VLGIFSIKYRQLASDAFECVIKTATLRKCKSGLDDRIRSQITGHLLRFSPGAASFAYRHYRLLSWLFLIIFVWSGWHAGIGMYNYAVYGDCNRPEETGFCLLDPAGSSCSLAGIPGVHNASVLPSPEQDDPVIGSPDASLTIIEFGCYSCPYTRRAEAVVRKVLDHYGGRVNLQFKTFEIPNHNMAYASALAADCAFAQGLYERYHDGLFAHEDINNETLREIAVTAGLNMSWFDECMTGNSYRAGIEADTASGISAGVIGTPTFFVNEKRILGPKPFRTFKKLIDGELYGA